MSRPYWDRDEDQRARARANAARYRKSPLGRLRKRARERAFRETAKAHPETYSRLYVQFVDEEYEKYERDQGLIT